MRIPAAHRVRLATITGTTLVGLAVLVGCTAAEAGTTVASKPSDQEIVALFDRWNAALQGDAQGVADLYAADAVLLPTVSPVVRANREQIMDYFADDFLPKKPAGTITESHVRIIDENSAVHSGNYTFALTAKGGNRDQVAARFTFVYEKIDGKWLIVEHHSSAVPAKS